MTEELGARATLNIDQFIRETSFSGYQRLTLPTGQVIPGTDRAPVANLVYPVDLTGKSVLDVGCYYGFFLHDAIRRGATRAVGIEADPDRYRIAKTLATLWDGAIDVHHGLVEDVELGEKFDVVLFLNVIHHVKDPVSVIRRLASYCRDTLVVEFRQPHDPQFVQECWHRQDWGKPNSRSWARRLARRMRTALETRLMERLTRQIPMIGVGSVEYHRSYFFSQGGFKNTFQVHNGLFRRVDFRPSLTPGQALAICDCSKPHQAIA